MPIAMLAPFAKAYGFALLAPIFSKAHSREYHILGANTTGYRTDLVFNAILEEAAAQAGLDASRIFLNGYSAGGRFAHRYALAYPEQHAITNPYCTHPVSTGWVLTKRIEKNLLRAIKSAGG